jgi:hypothetical protein
VDIVVAIGIIMKPIFLKNKILIIILIKTTIEETLNGIIVLSLAKKKFANIFNTAKAGMP